MKRLASIIFSALLVCGCSTVQINEAMANPESRCFGCDDVSDLMQCRECWGYHKQSEEHQEPPLVADRCPICQRIHKFTEPHVEPRPQVCGMACPVCGDPVGPLATTPHHCPHCPKLKVESKELKLTELERGDMSKISERSCYIIDNQDAWSALWNKHKGLDGEEKIRCGNDDRLPPNVDFTKEKVVGVFMGGCKTGGYKVFVTGVVEDGLNVLVIVNLVHPSDLIPRLEVLTYPFCIVKFGPDDLKKNIKFSIHEYWEK